MSRKKNLIAYPPLTTETSFTSLVTRVATDKLKPGELQDISNFALDSLGNLRKIQGNSVVPASEVTVSTTTLAESSTYQGGAGDDERDTTWDTDSDFNGAGFINGSFLKKSTFGLQFADTFFSGLSGTVISATLQLSSIDSSSYTGTAYRATATWNSQQASPPTYSTSNSVSITGSGENSTHTFSLPTDWITSWISSNTGMVVVATGSPTGGFISNTGIQIGYLFGGVSFSGKSNVLGYIDLGAVSSYNFSDGGTMQESKNDCAGLQGSIYGYTMGGEKSGLTTTNLIELIAANNVSQTASDAGDSQVSVSGRSAILGSTYGFFLGGTSNLSTPYVHHDDMEQITLATGSQNGTDVGNLGTATGFGASGFGATYGFMFGGIDSSAHTNRIIYITLATATQNTSDKGTLTVARYFLAGLSGTSNCFGAGGCGASGYSNVVDYFDNTSTSGNASDMGDLSTSTFATGVSKRSTLVGYAVQHTNGTAVDRIDTSTTTGNAVATGALWGNAFSGGTVS